MGVCWQATVYEGYVGLSHYLYVYIHIISFVYHLAMLYVKRFAVGDCFRWVLVLSRH